MSQDELDRKARACEADVADWHRRGRLEDAAPDLYHALRRLAKAVSDEGHCPVESASYQACVAAWELLTDLGDE